MKIYYSGYWRSEDVDSENPIEADHSTTLDVFWNLDNEGDFLGISLTEDLVFQVINWKDSNYVEILNLKTKAIQYANLEIEKIERLLEAIFQGEDIEKVCSEIKVTWQNGVL